MLMMRRSVVPTFTLILLTAAAAFAQGLPPANPGFDAGGAGWALPEGAAVADGELSLADGWAVSDSSVEPLEGWRTVEVRAKGPGRRSESALQIALIPSGAEPLPQVEVTASEMGGGWHTVSAQLLPPPGVPASVAIGVRGSDQWLIDSVSVAPAHIPAPASSEHAPVLPEPLPEHWEPDGLLDAVEGPLGAKAELLVRVGALQVAVPSEVTTSRGHRGAVRLIVRTRAMKPREMTVSLSGPPGFFAPDRTVTIRPERDTVFSASVQAFFVGTRPVRMTFRVGEDEASTAIRVTVQPSYPAPGIFLAGGDAPEPLTRSLAQSGIPLVAAAPDVRLPEHLTRLRLLPPPWSEEAIASAVAQAGGTADFMAVHHPRGEAPEADTRAATSALSAALTATGTPISTLGPPADLRPTSPPEIPEADLIAARELGAGRQIAAPSIRLPVLEARPAAAVTIDRKHATGAQPAWTALARSLQIGPVASAIRQNARLPMFFGNLAARSTGSAEGDAALLARALTICAHQGATGWTVPARPQDAPEGATAFCPFDPDGVLAEPVGRAYSELSRELAATIPLAILRQTPEIGSAPDAQVGFRPFMRNDEGILALWNNTGATVDLIFEVRTQPLDMHTITIGPSGVRRQYAGAFRFHDDAITLNRPVVFVTLQPGQYRLLSMQLARAHVGWLASVERRPKIERGNDGAKSFTEDWEERNLYR